jgi:hypothetical protein
MKKFFIVLSVFAVLGFCAVPSQALVGVPDAVPAHDILVPFFLVSMPGFGIENTLITITEVRGQSFSNDLSVNLAGQLHLELCDRNSVVRFNKVIKFTKYDVYVDDAASLISQMNIDDKKALEIDLDGDGVNDHWVGYIYYFNQLTVVPATMAPDVYNHFISSVYQVYLLGGMATGCTGVGFEFGWTARAADIFAGATPTGFAVPCLQAWNSYPGPDTGSAAQYPYDFRSALTSAPYLRAGWDIEAFSANALRAGKALLSGWWPTAYVDYTPGRNTPLGNPCLTCPYGPDFANWMRLMPRFFIYDALGRSLLILWTDSALTKIPLPGRLHVMFYDEDEHGLSANITIDRELNIIDVGKIVPGGLFPGSYPWGGWIDILTPDAYGAGWKQTDPLNPRYGENVGDERLWLGYSFQRAFGPAMEAWDVMFEVHRDAGLSNERPSS